MLVSVAQTAREYTSLVWWPVRLRRKSPWIIINSSFQCVANTCGKYQIMVF